MEGGLRGIRYTIGERRVKTVNIKKKIISCHYCVMTDGKTVMMYHKILIYIIV